MLHINKSQKQEHLKIHILLYFQNVYVLMTAVFTHSKIFFLFFQNEKKYLLNSFFLSLAERAAYNHYASFFFCFFFFIMCNNNHWNLCANCAWLPFKSEACVRTFGKKAKGRVRMRESRGGGGEKVLENI